MSWVAAQLDDPSLFVTAPGAPFPPHFRDAICNIFRRLFRVYTHIFHCHYEVSRPQPGHPDPAIPWPVPWPRPWPPPSSPAQRVVELTF